MQELLGNNDILIYSSHNEGKSLITASFIKTLKAKIYKKVTVNDSISYLSYLNKLVDQFSNTYHQSINKNLLIFIIILWLKKIEINPKAHRVKVNHRVRITKYNNIFCKGCKGTLKIVQEKNLLLILFGKLILGLIKLKI